MPQELPAAAGVEDAITRFDAARDAFAAELRDLHIRCGKPKQSMLVEAAARTAVEKSNDKFRLHPGTLSDVLRGKKTPTYDFLSALIRQLVMAQPGVGEYKQVWAQWDQRWQDLMRLKPQTDARRKGGISGPAREEAEPASAVVDGEAARIIAEAHQQAEAIRKAARAEAAAIIAQAHEQASAHVAHIATGSDAEANQAQAESGQLAIGPQQPVSPPSARPDRGSPGEERPGDEWLRSHGQAARPTVRRIPEYVVHDMAAANGRPLFEVAVYRWGSGQPWGTGIGPAAHSMPEEHAAEVQRALDPLLRPGRNSRTAPSLVRRVFTDVTAVVHRMPTVDEVGRSNIVSRVLFGSPSALTGSRAILLDCPSSTWLETVSGTIQPWTAEQLASEIQRNHSRFLGEIPRVRRQLEAVVAQLIRTPQARVSFLAPMGDGAHGQDSGARLLIWGLCAMLEKVTGDAYFSYSSLETHDFTRRLRLTCVPHWHVGHEDRRLVRIGFDGVLEDEAQELARDLVGFFLQAPDCPELIHEWLGWSLDHEPHTSQQGIELLADALRGTRRRWLAGARDTTIPPHPAS